MCRSIQTLRRADQPPTQAEIEAAALQFVRKVSGYRRPSRANQAAFDAAVAEVAAATHALLERLGSLPAPEPDSVPTSDLVAAVHSSRGRDSAPVRPSRGEPS